ncbi:VOC family protein [Streptomyces sp. NPDC020983]|uniref:VOC family protein n=1 Tax=Streptomyces sp. NPDC020983 TaxID=3365106 RepID=UPI0037A6F855
MNVWFAGAELAVRDLAEALDFYGGVLGFGVRGDGGPGGAVSVVPPAQPDVRIRLVPPGADGGVAVHDRRVVDALTADGLLARVAFRTGDCDAVFGHLVAAGAEVMREPADRSDGLRDCAFLDPSGNMLRFVEDTRFTSGGGPGPRAPGATR